jgi:hypothetical protein
MLSGVNWTVVERIIWAWIFTLPATGLIGFILARAVAAFRTRFVAKIAALQMSPPSDPRTSLRGHA